MLSSYSLRTTGLPEGLLQSLTHDSEKYLISEEIGSIAEHKHYHWFILTSINNSTLRQRIRKYGLKGNGSYSLKKLDEEFPIEYLAYAIKEGTYKHNLNEEELNKIKEYDLQVKNDIKKTKSSRKKVIELLIESLPEDIKEHHCPEEIIVNHIIQYHIESNLLINERRITDYAQTILYKLDIGNYQIQFKEKIYFNLKI